MYLTVEVKEEEVKSKVIEMVRDILQKEITMRWVRLAVQDEIKAEAKSLLKIMRDSASVKE